MTLNQADMKAGALSKVIRDIDATYEQRFELSMNTFLDNNNYLGLIQTEPEQNQFFNFEKHE